MDPAKFSSVNSFLALNADRLLTHGFGAKRDAIRTETTLALRASQECTPFLDAVRLLHLQVCDQIVEPAESTDSHNVRLPGVPRFQAGDRVCEEATEGVAMSTVFGFAWLIGV